MEARGWYGNDPALHDLRCAWHALHAAVGALTAVEGQPVKVYEPGPKYPL